MTTNATLHVGARADQVHPIAYVTMQDSAARARIMNVLERAGWAVVSTPTGFHLIEAISELIDGDRPWLRPGLIIVDARSRGCSGLTIATGLRDLGIGIPIVLVAAPGEALPVPRDATVGVVDAASAAAMVEALIGKRTPAVRLRDASRAAAG